MKVYNRNKIIEFINNLYDTDLYKLSDEFVARSSEKIINKNLIKPIAFYLPQFYPTEVNNINWGSGFTEWTNVTRAVPQYIGHYQPHVPECFGYYDLRNSEIMEDQCKLAKEYGLYGFCFYYYFFSGRTELELPIINYSANKSINFPFCLCWANENWTKRWDGKNEEILLKQSYEFEYLKLFIQNVSKYMLCDNYIRVKNKPLLIIYNACAIPNLDKAIYFWREYCKKISLGDIFLVCANTFGLEKNKTIIQLFDACVEFPPHGIYLNNRSDYLRLINTKFQGNIYHINDYIKTINNDVSYTLFRCAFPAWDNTSRVREKAKIFSDTSPDTFRLWLEKIIEYTVNKYSDDMRYIFINAWNEWGEGAHLEPDKKFGYAYLNILRACLNSD